MNNCTICGKKFTCGCQKTHDENGNVICKGCKNSSKAQQQAAQGSRNLSLELAKQQIVNLKNG
jgi:hypothetical protein|tara:strand:+ start:4542 stop:4730 length:189 start_codon:yes stop_codon:yes gene_type:complete